MSQAQWIVRFSLAFALLLCAPMLATAQSPEISYSATTEHAATPAGGTVKAVFTFNLGDTWHVNAHKPLDEFLIPTELVLTDANGISMTQAVYPEHVIFDLAGDKMAVYEHTFYLGAVLQIAR